MNFSIFLSNLFNEFEKCKIIYCIVRNFDNLPRCVDGDVDILIQKEDITKVEPIIKSLLDKEYIFVRKINRNCHLQFFITANNEIDTALHEKRSIKMLELDFVTALQWQGIPYVDTKSILSQRQWNGHFYTIADNHKIAHLVMHIILDKNQVSPKYKKEVQGYITTHTKTALHSLEKTLGGKTIHNLSVSFQSDNDAAILKWRQQIIKALVFRNVSSIISACSFMISKGCRIFRAIVYPPGVLLATAGPDGSGKTTILQCIGHSLEGTFSPIKNQYMGWKDFLLPTKHMLTFLKKVTSGSQPQKTKNSSPIGTIRPPWTHNFSVIHYFCDLLLRFFINIRPTLARGGVVLCDRYFYDILSQNIWLSNNYLTSSLLYHISPKPTVTITFTGDPNVIAARKNEISSEETDRQLAALSALKTKSEDVIEINASAPVEVNAKKILLMIFSKALLR